MIWLAEVQGLSPRSNKHTQYAPHDKDDGRRCGEHYTGGDYFKQADILPHRGTILLSRQPEVKINEKIIDGLLGVLIAMLGYFIKKKAEAWDAHIEECRLKATNTGKLEQTVEGLKKDAEAVHRGLTWVGDCIITIGAKMDVKLPERPQ